MKESVKKQRFSTAKDNRRGKRSFILKSLKKTQSGKKKVVLCDWQHLSKKDADIIVRLLKNPPAPNQATQKARALYMSIPQLG